MKSAVSNKGTPVGVTTPDGKAQSQTEVVEKKASK